MFVVLLKWMSVPMGLEVIQNTRASAFFIFKKRGVPDGTHLEGDCGRIDILLCKAVAELFDAGCDLVQKHLFPAAIAFDNVHYPANKGAKRRLPRGWE